MGKEIRYVCLVETRKLLLLLGLVLGLVLFMQYIELPYGHLLSLFTIGKSQVAPTDNFLGRNSSGTTSGNSTNYSSFNSVGLSSAYGESNTTKVLNGEDSDVTNMKDAFAPINDDVSLDISIDDIDPVDESLSNNFLQKNHNSTIERDVKHNNFTLKTTTESDHGLWLPNCTSNGSASLDHDGFGEIIQTSESSFTQENSKTGSGASVTSPSWSTEKKSGVIQNKENPEIMKTEPSPPDKGSSISSIPVKKGLRLPATGVVSLATMNDMLLQSHLSHRAKKPRWPSKVDQELLDVKSLIENAPVIGEDPLFDVDLYRNFSAFKRSYELMEKTLKVYTYIEGERPIFHQPPLKGIYASEGWFMKLLKANKRFVTKNPTKAHLFYLPFSSRMLEETLYVPNSHDRDKLMARLSDYVGMITTKYNFWNRTAGADHFLVACHDWAPAETRKIMANCIRALCNADINEGFQLGKDVSLPETIVRSPQNPLRQLGGKPASKRPILAFFAGSMHGYLRPVLLKYWENKDPDMKIFGQIRKGKGQMSYAQYMKSSKYCICAKGYEVNSPRVVEAIFYECVPVIISDNFVPPFFETLNWESFAVFVSEKDIPNLKNILLSISKRRYLKMQQRVKRVQHHFLWHSRPVKFDVFHMILHSIWYNRVFQTDSGWFL